ncbi:MAG TPA: DUF177 domain-containing protein [Acidimicrobiales bacterium]|nr:DUF177 domain-containing protein [Acidimicrobiales bacterium]
MTTLQGLVTPVTDLLRHPGEQRHIDVEVRATEIDVGDAAVPEGALVEIRGELASVSDAIVFTGTVRAPWRAVCRRCLGPAHGELVAPIREVFARPGREIAADDDVLPISGETIDLGPAVHDALALELPLAPLCREACAGLCPTCGVDRNHARCSCRADTKDPRWSALDALRLPNQARFDPGPAAR